MALERLAIKKGPSRERLDPGRERLAQPAEPFSGRAAGRIESCISF